MLLDPPYNNGIDAVIFETSLKRPIKARDWPLYMPQTERAVPDAATIARTAAMMPFATARDRYGIKGIPVRSHRLPMDF